MRAGQGVQGMNSVVSVSPLLEEVGDADDEGVEGEREGLDPERLGLAPEDESIKKLGGSQINFKGGCGCTLSHGAYTV